MLVYLYINKNNFNEYMCANAIVPSSLLRDGMRNRTIGIGLDNFLFVTHKKLNYASRSAGIAVPELLSTVTLAIEVNAESKKNNVILVSQNNGKVTYKLGTWSAYNAEKHIGAYMLGSIPLSLVKNVFYESNDDMQMSGLVSPDYWAPESLYTIIDDTFVEELNFEGNEQKLLETAKIKSINVLDTVNVKQKQQAMLLALFNGTQNWRTMDYAINMDCILQKHLGIKDADLKSVVPEYAKIKSGLKQEKLDVLPFANKEQKQDVNQILYNKIYELFLMQKKGSIRTAEDMSILLTDFANGIDNAAVDEKCKKEIGNIVERIINLIRGQSDELPEELAASIPSSIDCLKAVEFVARDPFDYVNLENSMNAYNLDMVNYRRALVIWSALNGMYSVPVKNSNKDNQMLWTYVESYIDKYIVKNLKSFSLPKALVKLEEGKMFGIALTASKLISVEDVHKSIMHNNKTVTSQNGFKEELESAVTILIKKVEFNKRYRAAQASVSINISAGDLLDAEKISIIKQLLEDSKPKNLKVNVPQLCVDYVMPLDKFKQVYQINPEYWRSLYEKLEGK